VFTPLLASSAQLSSAIGQATPKPKGNRPQAGSTYNPEVRHKPLRSGCPGCRQILDGDHDQPGTVINLPERGLPDDLQDIR
jgi:hypothetical protein